MTEQEVGIPPRTRLQRLIRIDNGWRVWIDYSPCKRYGTYLILHDGGAITRVVVREDEGDEYFIVKESE